MHTDAEVRIWFWTETKRVVGKRNKQTKEECVKTVISD